MKANNISLLRILLILFAAQTSLTAGGLSVAPIAPFIKVDLHLSEAQIGFFLSSFYAGATLTSLPSGSLADFTGVKKILIAGLFISGFSLVFFSFFSKYALLLFFMFLAGFGYSTINPISTKAIMDWVPSNRRAMAMGFKQTGVTVGGALSAALLPVLALSFGWRFAVLTSGIFLLIVGTASYFLYIEKKTDDTENEKENNTVGYMQILRDRKIVVLSLLCTVLSASQLSLITYMVTYFYEHLKLDIVLAGSLLALAQTGGTLGRLAWGIISDMFLGGRKKPLMIIIAAAASAGMFFMSLVVPGTSYIVLAVLVTVLGFSAIGWNALYLVLIGHLAGKKNAGTATGLSLIFIFIGTVIGPPSFGALADITGSFRLAYQFYAVMLGIVAVCFAVFKLEASSSADS